MRGHVAKKGQRYYAVIYEGVDAVTGRQRHRWYAGSSRWSRELRSRGIPGAGQGSRHRRGCLKAATTRRPLRWATVAGWRRRCWDLTGSGCSR